MNFDIYLRDDKSMDQKKSKKVEEEQNKEKEEGLVLLQAVEQRVMECCMIFI